MLAQSPKAFPPQSESNDSALPGHIAVIMDGNGRWAQQRGLPRVAGHRRGVEIVKEMVSLCGKRGVPYLTLFAFSSENWKRPGAEVRVLIELLITTLDGELHKLHENNIRLRVIGDMSRFPDRLQSRVAEAEKLTGSNTALNLTIAINYGGRWDMTEACRAVAEEVARGEMAAADISEETIASHLCTRDLPEPDLFIRTGGEQRVSNFLLWQLAYTELYFCDTYWPEFDQQAFDDALEKYAGRERRFGRTGEQLAGVAEGQ